MALGRRGIPKTLGVIEIVVFAGHCGAVCEASTVVVAVARLFVPLHQRTAMDAYDATHALLRRDLAKRRGRFTVRLPTVLKENVSSPDEATVGPRSANVLSECSKQ